MLKLLNIIMGLVISLEIVWCCVNTDEQLPGNQ